MFPSVWKYDRLKWMGLFESIYKKRIQEVFEKEKYEKMGWSTGENLFGLFTYVLVRSGLWNSIFCEKDNRTFNAKVSEPLLMLR